jgi:hypothetical protein
VTTAKEEVPEKKEEAVPVEATKKVEVVDSKENLSWWKQSSETMNPDEFSVKSKSTPQAPSDGVPIGGTNGFKRINIEDDSSEEE